MKIHCFQHVEYETPGYILNWIEKKGYSIEYTKFYDKKFSYPEMSGFDFLLIMGGPMGVYEEDKYLWLKQEKEFVKKAIENNKIVLGICLGAQIIAAALGKKVYKNKYKEIGWFPVFQTHKVKESNIFKGLPKKMTVFHWHGDTFDLPQNSIHLAKSDGAENQAFIINNKVLGLQFHFEITEDIVSGWMKDENIIPDRYVQDKSEIVKLASKFSDENNKYLEQVLNNLVGE